MAASNADLRTSEGAAVRFAQPPGWRPARRGAHDGPRNGERGHDAAEAANRVGDDWLVCDDWPEWRLRASHTLYVMPEVIAEDDLNQFVDREILAPRRCLRHHDDGLYRARFHSQAFDAPALVAAVAGRIGAQALRVARFVVQGPGDGRAPRQLVDMLDAVAASTRLDLSRRRRGEPVASLETRLVAPYQEIQLEVPWGWRPAADPAPEPAVYVSDAGGGASGGGELLVGIERFFLPEGLTASRDMFIAAMRHYLAAFDDDAADEFALSDCGDVLVKQAGSRSQGARAGAGQREIASTRSPGGGPELGPETMEVKWLRLRHFDDAFIIANFDLSVPNRAMDLPQVRRQVALLEDAMRRAKIWRPQPPA